MEFNSGGFKTDKLRDYNFHTCKHRILLILSLKELDDFIKSISPDRSDATFDTWLKYDQKAKAIIGIILSYSHLEQVQHASTSQEMLNLI